MTNGEEENGDTATRGRPNAYFAKIKQEQEEQLEAQERGDTFSGAFRGTKPPPHGGTARVKSDDVLGTEEYCWCGQPVGHDWPGKRVGAKHPRVEERAVSTAHVEGSKPDIDRRDLRAYHRRLQDFVMSCVGEGVRYRISKNSVILYPPDGTTPMSVYARNTDRQLRQLQKWYIEHVYSQNGEATVDEATLAKLAEAKNDPVEHPKDHHPKPAREDEDTPRGKAYDIPEPADVTYTEEPAKPEEYLPPPPSVTDTDEWRPYVTQEGKVSTNIVTTGSRWKCLECVDTDHPLDSVNIRSVGGHNRIYHTDTSNMHSEEARQKATETRRANLISSSKMNQAIELLMEVAGYELPHPDTSDLEDKVAELEAALAAKNTDLVAAEDRAEKATARADELEAKLALIREATGL